MMKPNPVSRRAAVKAMAGAAGALALNGVAAPLAPDRGPNKIGFRCCFRTIVFSGVQTSRLFIGRKSMPTAAGRNQFSFSSFPQKRLLLPKKPTTETKNMTPIKKNIIPPSTRRLIANQSARVPMQAHGANPTLFHIMNL